MVSLESCFWPKFLIFVFLPPEAEAAYNESLVHCTLLFLRSHHPFPSSSPFFIHPRIIKGSHLFWKEEEEEKEENFVSRFGSKKGESESGRAPPSLASPFENVARQTEKRQKEEEEEEEEEEEGKNEKKVKFVDLASCFSMEGGKLK